MPRITVREDYITLDAVVNKGVMSYEWLTQISRESSKYERPVFFKKGERGFDAKDGGTLSQMYSNETTRLSIFVYGIDEKAKKFALRLYDLCSFWDIIKKS